MLDFIVGMIVGGLFGVFAMALVTANKNDKNDITKGD